MTSLRTTYSVSLNNSYTLVERQSIEYLYQPLIGIKAFALYQFLVTEGKLHQKSMMNAFTVDRFEQFLHCDQQDLAIRIQLLVNHQLLSYRKDKINHHWSFILQKPLLFAEFSKSVFFPKYRQLIKPSTLESVYLLFRQHSHCQQLSNSHLLQFLNSLKCLKHYPLKVEDYLLLKDLHYENKVSLEIIQVILEFCFFKTTTLRHNYLIKVLQTLREGNILTNILKVKNFFRNLYQKMTIQDLLQLQNRQPPQWLVTTTANCFSSKKETNSSLLTQQEFEETF